MHASAGASAVGVWTIARRFWTALTWVGYRFAMLGYGGALAVAGWAGNRRARAWWRMREGGEAQLAAATARLAPGTAWAWFHCASLGEYEQARPVIEAYRALRPQDPILLTFFSPSGWEPLAARRPAWWQTGDHLAAVPWDVPRAYRPWLRALGHPRMRLRFLALSKYEVWPDQLRCLRGAGIPTAVFAAYHPEGAWPLRPVSGLLHAAWCGFDRMLVQDPGTAERWRHRGVPAQAVGDPRADRVMAIATGPPPTGPEWAAAVRWVGTRRCLVAGSTWAAEERALAELGWPPSAGRCWICVPHEVHPAHIDSLLALLTAHGLRWTRWSQMTAAPDTPPPASEILVVDSMGWLASLYRLGHVAFVGGGFGKGVHNTLEPAAHGLPIVTGPRIERFREVKALQALGALQSASRPGDLASLLHPLLDDPTLSQRVGADARNWVAAQTGAAAAIASTLAALASRNK